jgi:hypothetical protein
MIGMHCHVKESHQGELPYVSPENRPSFLASNFAGEKKNSIGNDLAML